LLERALEAHEDLGIVLEIGGGTGTWTPLLAKRATRVVFVEPSRKMLNIARKKNRDFTNVEYVQSTLEEFVCPVKADTLVVLGDVLSYVTDAEKAMKKLWSLSKRGAILIGSVDGYYRGVREVITVGAFDVLRTLERFKRLQVGNPKLTSESMLTRMYTPSELENLLESNGFSCQTLAGVDVFGPYEDRFLSRHMEEIVSVELRYSMDRQVLGVAEHLFFLARRRW